MFFTAVHVLICQNYLKPMDIKKAELFIFSPGANCVCFSFKNYMDYLSRLYDREIKDFFEVAKIKMTGATKEGKKFGKFFLKK